MVWVIVNQEVDIREYSICRIRRGVLEPLLEQLLQE